MEDTGRKIILPGQRREIEKSTWIENTYYVDDKGVMVKNSWVHTDGKDGLKEEAGISWARTARQRRLEERRRRPVQL